MFLYWWNFFKWRKLFEINHRNFTKNLINSEFFKKVLFNFQRLNINWKKKKNKFEYRKLRRWFLNFYQFFSRKIFTWTALANFNPTRLNVDDKLSVSMKKMISSKKWFFYVSVVRENERKFPRVFPIFPLSFSYNLVNFIEILTLKRIETWS